MLRLLAQFISFIFHPLLMPTWLFGIMMYYFPSSVQPTQAWFLVIILIFGMTFILPLLNLLLFKITGTIQSFFLAERKDRILPFIFITIVYGGITAMIFWKMSFPIVFKLMLIITCLALLVTVATFFFKISAHAVAGGGMVGMLLSIVAYSSVGELLVPSIVILVLAGMVMSARLLLNAHKPQEVGWGGVLGFVMGFVGTGVLF